MYTAKLKQYYYSKIQKFVLIVFTCFDVRHSRFTAFSLINFIILESLEYFYKNSKIHAYAHVGLPLDCINGSWREFTEIAVSFANCMVVVYTLFTEVSCSMSDKNLS